MKKVFFYLLLLAGFCACSDENSSELEQVGSKAKMVVVNEGQFTKGTAALSAITMDGQTDFDIFRQVNNRPLGDVAQSLSYIKGLYYVALNNSKKIEVVEPHSFKSIATINYEASGSPRFIVPVNDTEAIVSDLNRQLVRISTATHKVLEFIPMDRSVEKMCIVGNKLFGESSGELIVFDKENISQAGVRIVEGIEGRLMKTAKIILDKNNKIWVFATESGKSILNCVDPTTEKVEKTIEIPYVKSGTEEYVDNCITGTSYYTRMDTDASRGKLYFFMTVLAGKKNDMGAIITLDVNKDAIDSTPYRVLPGLGMMYGMNISPEGDVYLCDCLDYTAQRGYLREYKANGDVLSHRVGIYPRMVHFPAYDN